MAITRHDSEDRATHWLRIIIGGCLALLAPFVLIVFTDFVAEVFFGVPGTIGAVLGIATTTSIIAAVVALITIKRCYTRRRRRIHLLIAVNGALWLLLAIVSTALFSVLK